MAPVPHPFIIETPEEVRPNCPEIGRVAVLRLNRAGVQIGEAVLAASEIAHTVDEAWEVLAGRRRSRGEGATRKFEFGATFGDRGPGVGEPEMDAAVAAYRKAAGKPADLDGLRAAIYAAHIARLSQTGPGESVEPTSISVTHDRDGKVTSAVRTWDSQSRPANLQAAG